MKNIFALCVAAMLALPAMSHAGSATSRWDLSIGGQVKLDYFYADQSVNQDTPNAFRQGSGANTSSIDKYGATSWGAGESRLNFLVKGPDTWGARTSAFIEGDFSSLTSNSVSDSTRNNVENYGLFYLRHAYMKFEWPTFTVVAGQTWSIPGNLPSFVLLGANENGSFNRGILVPEIYGVWQATKTFSITGGIQSPYPVSNWPGGTLSSGQTIDDGFQRSNLPLFFGELNYRTDALGKIGALMLQVGVGGIWGQEKPISPPAFGPVGDINSGQTYLVPTALATAGNQGTISPGSNTVFAGFGPGNSVQYWSYNGYDSNTVNAWMLTFKSFIPIVPEKAPGKQAHSLGVGLAAFTGQDMTIFAGNSYYKQGVLAYDRTGYAFRSGADGYIAYNTQPNPNANFVAPVNTGGWVQLMYHWTDTLWSGFYYGQNRVSLSNARKGNQYGFATTQSTISSNAIEREEEYHVNLIYDPNPAIRLGIEYSYYSTHYGKNLYNIATINGVPSGLTSGGSVNTVRFSAIYFF